jgi:hypothetical protein
MAEETSRSCAACGHPQAGGDFCEACGTRLPLVAPPPPQQPTPPAQAPPQASYPPPYASPPASGPQGGYPPPGAYPPQYGPPPGYGVQRPRGESVWDSFSDWSFRRILTPAVVKLAWIATMVFVALYVIYNIIVIARTWGPADVSLFALFRTLAFAFFLFVIVRVFLEIAMAVAGMREKK